MKHQQGFTLIELMIVVTIIGILAALALPAYQDYAKRARVSEGLTLASGAKAAMSEYHATYNQFPTSNDQAGLESANKITGNAVQSVEVKDGKITITFDKKVEEDATIELTPTFDPDNGGSYEWSCKDGGTLASKYRPAECRP